MTIRSYGVLAGTAVDAKLAGKGAKPHYQIHIVVEGVHHRVAVNVVSDQSPSELLFLLQPDYHHGVLQTLPEVADGFTAVPSRPGGLALDFVRGGLFRPEDMKALPFDAPGPDNDLHEIFDLHARQAIDAGARFYAFGSKWGPEPGKADEYFGFQPGNGIHDIHLNQGSPRPHSGDNGVWQDGALFIHFPAEDRWLAFFWPFNRNSPKPTTRGIPFPALPSSARPPTLLNDLFLRRRRPGTVWLSNRACLCRLTRPVPPSPGVSSATCSRPGVRASSKNRRCCSPANW